MMPTRTSPLRKTLRPALVGLVWAILPLAALASAFETIALKQLPGPLHSLWGRTKPEMNENSRCAAAFDGDPEKMTLRCSVYVRMAAEAERRAMLYCEEDRAKKHIHAPCRIVKE
jgi:hypothetical protein